MPIPDNNQDNPSKLDRLKRRLYERSVKVTKVRHSPLSSESNLPPTNWEQSDPGPISSAHQASMSILKKLFWIVLAIFVVSSAVAGFVFWHGSNTVSPGNVEVEIDGPISIRAGETVGLQVSISNNNSTDLEFVDLITTYPTGTLAADGSGLELTRVRETLGTIRAGQTINRQLSAVLFGERNSELEVRVAVEYRLAQSNAIFDKSASYQLTISGSPLLLNMEVPAEVNSSQEIVLDIEVIANSETPLTGTVTTLEYPPGFQFSRSVPAPSNGNNSWTLPTLEAGDDWQLRIFGTLEGQDDDEKTFRARAGMPSPSDPTQVGALYGSDLQAVAIRRPYITLSAKINNDPATDYIANSRQNLRLDIDWQNNLATNIVDGEVLVQLNGRALEQTSVSPGRGLYQSNTDTVIWNKNNEDDLADIAPGQGGRVSVSFSSLALGSGDNYQIDDPTIKLDIKFRGRRTTESGSNEQIETDLSRQVKFNTVLQLAAKVLHYTGPFTNTGVLPPKVGEETGYTIIWTVVNSSNDIREAKVSASLPPYVRWLGETAPGNEPVTFTADNSGGGTLTWNLGTVKAGTGHNLAPRELAFRVGLVPGLNQVGSEPDLVSSPRLTTTDTFTGQSLELSYTQDLNTNLDFDPQFQRGQGKVVR